MFSSTVQPRLLLNNDQKEWMNDTNALQLKSEDANEIHPS